MISIYEQRGIEKGIEQGVLRGQREFLLNLLRSKFGAVPPSVNVTPLNVHVTGKADAFDKQANVNTSNATQPRMKNRKANIGNPLMSPNDWIDRPANASKVRSAENYAPA